MGISKNNPDVRDNQRLFVYCPVCNSVMNILMRVPGRKMFYVCSNSACGHDEPISPGSYKSLKHEWKNKK